MKKRINEEMYIEIFKDIIRDNNDYGDKSKVRKHNAAATKIAKQIAKNNPDKEFFVNLVLKQHNKL